MLRFTRSPDWPKKLHYAADGIEKASAALIKAVSMRDYEQALFDLTQAQRMFGREMLKLDKQRRPDFYRNANSK